jgi:capsular polysaccharide biosynthesis protein
MSEDDASEPTPRPTRRRATTTRAKATSATATTRLRRPTTASTDGDTASQSAVENGQVDPARYAETPTPAAALPPPPMAAAPPPLAPLVSQPAPTVAPQRSGLRRALGSPALMLAILALVLGILAGGFTAYYEYTRPATYRSSTVMLIDQPATISASSDVGVVSKLSQLRIKYVGIVKTEIFAQPVADQTGLPIGLVLHSLTATADPTSLLVLISSTTRDPAQAHTIAEAAANELTTYVKTEQEVASVPPRRQITFTVATPATNPVRVTPDRPRAKLVGLFVFIAITIVGFLGADLLRRRRRG